MAKHLLYLGGDVDQSFGKLLIIEPYYGGSHKKMIDAITEIVPMEMFTLVKMSPKIWHWRARTAALFIAARIPRDNSYELMICSSVLPLAELIGLRPDLARLHKVIYFHENQLEYPLKLDRARDFQYGFNEILSCLAADQVLYNSNYNMESFITRIPKHLRHQQEFCAKMIQPIIQAKSKVVYYPLNLAKMDSVPDYPKKQKRRELIIVWPHRWEYDKNPEAFYKVIRKLDADNLNFKVCLLGESFSRKPVVFNNMEEVFKKRRLLHCGYIPDELAYFALLKKADVVVSTALHEFFGVAVMESVYCGCIPVVPKRLAYSELYENDVEEMYETDEELYHILKTLCLKKQKRKLSANYSYLAKKYESNAWFNNMKDVIDCKIFD